MAEALTDELVEEILVRLPPGDPVSLARAAAACRQWRRVASAPSFRHAFARRHRAAPMLGFVANLRDGDGGDPYDFVARFVPATPFRPRRPDRRDRRALDARHGRVLLLTTPWGPNLEVWDPVTDQLRALPRPPLPDSPFSWNAAVACAAAHGECDHLACSRGPFLVVFLDSDTEDMRVHVYSSESGAWTGPVYGPPSPTYGVEMVPTALVGNAIHFLIDATNSILKYDLATRSVSVIHLPPGFVSDFAVLTTSEDGGLGFARVEKSRLWLWSSMETGPEGDAVWTQNRSVELETLLGVEAASIDNDCVGFAHGVGLFFVRTEDAWFSIDLKSGWVKEEDCGDGHTHGIVPYTSFYTPGTTLLSP
ncbi:hypothetical protein BAE44_0025426 [Dichanthelium oligosanthes]|uniref:F-box protein AT5G49610-like beta-propeller domain-containing protein n=1 Tax=Dichanthelium oligosanthes TaxID=888268 RepID=A0A1E5UKZ7_9POAL|nr:hypothetical protein BAE44_0025426 [Dichanthelium oligosanthes]